MPVRTNAHHTQFPATPVRLTMSVTRLGVSALKVVATIDKPASHHGTARPDPKNSEVLRPARLAKNSAGPKQMRSEAPTMNQSSAVRCMNDRVQSIPNPQSSILNPQSSILNSDIGLAPMERLQPLIGLVLIGLIAYSLSTNRKAIRVRTIAWGFGLQFLFALIVLKTAYGQYTFEVLGEKIRQLLGFAAVGSSFVFGALGNQPVWARIMNTVLGPEGAQYGVIFAFQIAPTIIFIAALFAMLY